MIDEMEHLLNKDRAQFEHINEFLSISLKGFVKIGISNTLDLFSSVQSKQKTYMKYFFVPFRPYKHDQIENILSSKIDDIILDSGDFRENYV